MKHRHIFKTILPALLLLTAIAGGNGAWAQTFSVSSTTEGTTTTFKIRRSGSYLPAQTIMYRTVNLSAYAGEHYTAVNESYTFGEGDTVKRVSVTERSVANIGLRYRYQGGTERSYRFEVLDVNGFELAHSDRSISYGEAYKHSNTYVNQSVTDLLYFNGGSIASGSGNKYVDVAYDPSTNSSHVMSGSYIKIDDGYDYDNHTLCNISTGSLYSNHNGLRDYLNTVGCKMYATVYFTQKEEDDGYQYIQILADNSSTYDGKDGDGKIDKGPTTSIYKAAFILTKTESTCTTDHYQAFPHRYDCFSRTACSQTSAHTEFEYSDSYLYEQKYQSTSYNAANNGALALNTTVNTINVRFDANGSGDDTWYLKNLKVRLALVDATKPTLLNGSTAGITVSAGPYKQGNTFYISVPFSEIVHISGAHRKVNTSWGVVEYIAGDNTNVITYKGTIDAPAGTELRITGIDNCLFNDLAINYYQGDDNSFNKTFSGVTCTATYTLDNYNTVMGGLADEYIISDNAIEPVPTTVYFYKGKKEAANRVSLSRNSDYSLAWANNSAVGTGRVIASGMGGYTGSASATFPISWASYTVNYNANGSIGIPAAGTMGEQAFQYGVAQNLTANAFSREGFTFAGWNTQPDGSGESYDDGQSVAGLNAEDGGSVELYAQWTVIPWEGNGSQGSPYIIIYASQLDSMAGGNRELLRNNFKLGADIGYSYSSDWDDTASSESNFMAIGTMAEANYFGGTFDGDGHTISGIRINSSEDRQGLFKRVYNGIVKNVTLSDSRITGNDYVGGIVGYASNSTIQNCRVLDNVCITGHDYVGGIVGQNGLGPVQDNVVSGARISGNESVGGIEGRNYGSQNDANCPVKGCLVLNATITASSKCGAIVGYMGTLRGHKNNLYYNCTVNGIPNATSVGVGDNAGSSPMDRNECFEKAQTITLNNADIADTAYGNKVITYQGIHYYAPGSTIVLTYTGTPGYSVSYSYNDGSNHLIGGNSFKLSSSNTITVSRTLTDKWGIARGATGEEGSPYLIGDTAGLSLMAHYVNGGSGYAINPFNGKYFRLTNDISYSYDGLGEDESNYTAIGTYSNEFRGIFDGNGNTVSGIRISRSNTNNQGMFGWVYGGTIKNVTLRDVVVKGHENVGGIVGYIGINRDSARLVENTVIVGASVSGTNCVGAIVGRLGRGTVATNYYRMCRVGGVANATEVGVGCESENDNSTPHDLDGARSLHTLRLGAGVSATGASETKVIGDTTYYANASSVTLSAEVPTGYTFSSFSATSTLSGATNPCTLTFSPATDDTASVILIDHWNIAGGANGTVNHPYIITTTQGLDLLASDVNGGNTYGGTYFKLGADITYTHLAPDADGADTENNYTPIGNLAKAFCGTFDGCGYTVSGIRIYTNDNYQGLFGRIYDATVKNLKVTDARIKGNWYVGGIAGQTNGSSTRIDSCVVSSLALTADDIYCGGIVGYVERGHISRCLVLDATVSASNKKGAVVGNYLSYSNFNSNYYYNCTVGGVANATGVGTHNGDIAANNGAMPIHIMTPGADVTITPAANLTFDNNNYYTVGSTITLGYTGLVPFGYYTIYSYNDGASHGINGASFTMPNADITVSAIVFPDTNVQWQIATGADGTEEHPYIITTVTGLNLLSTLVGMGNNYSGKHFRLGNDIVYSHTTDWDAATSTENNYTAIGTFSGTFDGQGYTVGGIRIYGGDNYACYLGLFGSLNGGAVKNVTLSDARITGYQFIGGIVGNNGNGTIENCHVTDSVAIHAISDIAGMHGGIVGTSNGTVDGCTSGATITADNYSGCGGYGGIAGVMFGGSVRNCFALGAQIDNNSVGGAIVGNVVDGTLASNYYHACIVNENTANIGCGVDPEGDITADDGALPVYSITLGEHITTTPEAAVSFNNSVYYKAGTIVTLNAEGYILIGSYTVKYAHNNNIYVSVGNEFTMPAGDVTVSASLLESPWRGSGAEEDPFIISTPEDLVALSDYTNSGYGTIGKYFLMVNDIDMSSVENFTPIGGMKGQYYHFFEGSFNGNNHTIKHLAIDDVEFKEIGLFGYLNSGSVTGVTLDSATIRGLQKVGGIVGVVTGNMAILSCRVENSSFYTVENPSVGAICYYNNSGDYGIMRDNYYYNCSVNGSPAPTGIGMSNGDKCRGEIEFAMPITDISFEVKAGQWQAIASPFVIDNAFFFSTDLTEGVYDLLYYSEPSATWVNCKNEWEPAFLNGVGYIYRTSTTGTRRMQGVLRRALNEYVNVRVNAYNGDVAFKGFNLLGNPHDIPICLQDARAFSEYVDGYYTLSPDGCWQAHLLSDTIAAGQAFLVQVSMEADLYIPVPTEESKSGRLNEGQGGLRFEVSDGKHSDIVYALTEGRRNMDGMDNSDTKGLHKFGHMEEWLPTLNIARGDARYAIAMLGDSTEAFEMNFSGKAGTYTIKQSSNLAISYLHLIDKVAGTDIDLLRDSTYSFTHSDNQAIANRFLVKLSPYATTPQQSTASFARLEGDHIVVTGEGTLQVFDMMGRQLFTREANSSLIIHHSSFPSTGVYMLRLGGQSQKIVIR